LAAQGAEESDGTPGGEGVPLFILSPLARDELTRLATRAGWKPVAARRRERAESRYLGSLARTALIDARGQSEAEALVLVGSLAEAVEASGGAMLILVDAVLAPALPRLIGAGATHFLEPPVDEARLRAALLCADRLAERLVGSLQAVRNRHAVQRGDALFWRWNGAQRTLSISPALASLIEEVAPGVDYRRWGVTDLVRQLDRAERAGAIAAIRQTVDNLMPAAFAHGVRGQPGRRLVHHLYPDSTGFSGEIEALDTARSTDNRDRDFMTGLASRRGALGWVGHELMAGREPVLLLLAISDFDRINTAYGAVLGDAMLSRVALRLTRLLADLVGKEVMVARVAGAEFLIGLPAAGQTREQRIERGSFIARQLLGEVERPFNAGDHLIRLTARGGIALTQAGDDAERLLRRAGSALADARGSGGQGSIRLRVANRRSLELDQDRLDSDLRLALDRGEIQLLFQPQFRTADDAMVGVEALARWHHPVHGDLGAGALFAVAERSDFLLPLSDHIQARALAEAAGWGGALASLRLAINLTAADLAQPGFVEQFLAMVDASGFPRGRLTVELTESGLIESIDAAAEIMAALREAGVAIAIDDFGTGYSSLSYLKSLPLDYLKIDSGLARDIGGTGRDRVIVRAIIDMAKTLGLCVIAEGVESEEQLHLLARAGCDIYQGFLRAPPVDTARLATFAQS
jgi:EAL domain-containing protein (putative c-di-GMP-specific phosphodiesterase class I)/GGDEF domain-containing protein